MQGYESGAYFGVCEHFGVRRTRAKFTNQNDFSERFLFNKRHKLLASSWIREEDAGKC